jgi:hypothetical protein
MFNTSSPRSSGRTLFRNSHRRAARAAIRPCVQQLEVRRLLASIGVNTFGDSVVPADGLTSLREAIALAADPVVSPGADTIELPAGTYALGLGQLTIHDATGAVTIESSGGVATVDAGGHSRVFEVSNGSNVEFHGLTITGGSADEGGGVYNGATLTITASTISGNAARIDGGGIYNDGGTVTVTDSAVTENVAEIHGGGIYNDGGLATVAGSTLSRNSADDGSGRGPAGEGGGIYNSGTATITDSSVQDNTAGFGFGGGGGGGGRGADSHGGGIYNIGTATITASALRRNIAGSDGGGIFNAGVATVTHSTLSDNLATGGGSGGGICHESGTLTITASNLFGNSCENFGGAIVSGHGSTVTIADSTLSGNAAFGGAAFTNFGIATLTASRLNGNYASYGGAVYNLGMATIAGSTLSANTALYGGGIYNEPAATLNIATSTLGGNFAGEHGGGICNIGGEVVIDASTVSPNSAAINGGGIYNSDGGTTTVSNSTLSGNSAILGGGGVFNQNGGTVTVAASTLSGNLARNEFGGGISNHGGTATITDSTLSGNTAYVGGGIYTHAATTTITSSTVRGNVADHGGGIFIDVAGTTTITASTISGNSARYQFGKVASPYWGGGIYIERGGSATINTSTVSDNSADQGGGIKNSGTAVIGNTIVAGNQAGNAPDVSGAFVSSEGYNLIGVDDAGSFTGPGDQVGTTAAPINPLLGPLANNGGPTLTHALLPGSPALDAGDPALAGSIDQRGVARPQGPRVDIGAVEIVQVANTPPTAVDDTATGDQDQPITGNVLANDSDADGDDLNILAGSVNAPLHGTLVMNEETGAFNYTPNTGYFGTDSFKYRATDGDGATSNEATVTITIAPAAPGSIYLIPDSCDPTKMALVVNGTTGDDSILISPATGGVQVFFNGVSKGFFSPTGRIIVYGYDGNDSIELAGSVPNAAWLYGDEGNDSLNLGNGGGIAFGLAGADNLHGGSGRDILVGGDGADRIVGNAGDDILISSLTIYDDRFAAGTHEDAWCGMYAEWNSSRNFAQRVDNLRDGSGTSIRANGMYRLNDGTIMNDLDADQVDILTGSSGEDWYLYNSGDKATGMSKSESGEAIGSIV